MWSPVDGSILRVLHGHTKSVVSLHTGEKSTVYERLSLTVGRTGLPTPIGRPLIYHTNKHKKHTLGSSIEFGRTF